MSKTMETQWKYIQCTHFNVFNVFCIFRASILLHIAFLHQNFVKFKITRLMLKRYCIEIVSQLIHIYINDSYISIYNYNSQ